VGISKKMAALECKKSFAMPRDFFDPTPEQQIVVLVGVATLRKAERLIESCEQCNPEGAQIPFDNILERVTGSDPRRDGLHSGRTGEVSELSA
jgi:hypothetical protein